MSHLDWTLGLFYFHIFTFRQFSAKDNDLLLPLTTFIMINSFGIFSSSFFWSGKPCSSFVRCVLEKALVKFENLYIFDISGTGIVHFRYCEFAMFVQLSFLLLPLLDSFSL